ncbi:superoxide dismutase [Candidatus Woesearchaeota archaeon]|nr:superoxide dismutase [Candidatus Woesearchaeota archaeon]
MHELPKLDYGYDALEPHIDEKTMRIHHTKHHQGYVDKLNEAVKGTEFESMTAEGLLMHLEKVPERIRTAVRNNGGGHYNHSLFWKVIGPDCGGKPGGKLGDDIQKKWGSFEKFKEEFSNAAAIIFGSGWAWLVADKGKLEITITANQDSPISKGKMPLIGLDIWEHAYYLRYQNKRPEYIKAWWNMVDWKRADERYRRAL